MSERAARMGLLAVLLLYLAAGVAYSLLAPLGEAPDELAHFQYMRYIAEEQRIPRSAEERSSVGRKGHEPPLYYALLGLATSWVDTRPVSQIKVLDPERYPRHSLPDEVLIDFAPLHTADEAWPFQGLVLVWHLARLGSLVLMAAALAVVFQALREAVPAHPGLALLGTTAAALTPQFVYIGSSLNNDALGALLGGLVLWVLLRLARGTPRWRQFLLLGVLLGLARLTKFYALALLPEVGLVLAILAWRQRQARYLGGLAVALALSLAVPAPWLLYIQPVDPAVAHGWGRVLVLLDVVHTERWFGAGGEGQAGSGALALVRALWDALRLQPLRWALTLFQSFWGYFGSMTIAAPRPVYPLAAALSGLSLLGWLRLLADRLRGRATVLAHCHALWVPALQLLAFLGTEAVFYGVMQRLPDTAQARHLYPALGGLALFLALGWWGLWQPLASAPAVGGLALLLVGMTGYCLPAAMHAAGRPPLPVRSTPWPGAPAPAAVVDLGDGLLLEGTRWTTPQPGLVEGTLYWRAAQPPAHEAVIILEMLDGSGAVRAVWAGHPGGSRYPTEAWAAGDRVRQELRWPLPAPFPSGPQALRLRLLRDGQEEAALTLPSITLPPAPAAAAAPRYSVAIYGREQREAHLRDTILVTGPAGARLAGLAATDGLMWRPLARTARGDQMALLVDGGVGPGRYTVVAEGDGAGSRAPTVSVDVRRRAYAPPKDLQPAGALFGGRVELFGYKLKGQGAGKATPGHSIRLRLVWRARERIDRHYTVFVHLIDEQGRLWGQIDGLPGHDYSTLFWAPGEMVTDDRELPVDPATPPGKYRLVVGLYQALGGARAPVVAAQGQPLGDQYTVAEITVPGQP